MAMCCLCFEAIAQNLPDYVPTDGLVAWYPFNGNANDESGNGNNGQNNGVAFVTDRFGTVNSAGSFNGVSSYVNGSLVGLNNPSETTLSIWLLSQGDAGGQPYDLFFQLGNYGQHTFAYAYNHSGTNIDLHSNCFYNPYSALDINDEWHHLVIVSGVGTASFYVDGELFVNMNSANWGGGCYLGSNAFYIGGGADNQYTTGLIDEVGFWDRALTEAEIEVLYTSEIPISGCTDETACNFDSEATSDEGSCIPSGCMEAGACNYNAQAECEGEACDYSCCPGPGCCGEGMYWDYELEQCMVSETCQEDLDGDGVIGINDLMQLLSSFGTMCPIWMCGDPVNYHGYDYTTVQIGEQCWFAENLRTELYRNGDAIQGNLDDTAWSMTTEGAHAIFGEGNSECIVGGGYSDPSQYLFDVCDEAMSLEEFGRLYNSYAIMDIRGVCPSGWEVAENGEWNVLEDHLDSEGFSGMESEVLKSVTGWNEQVSGTDVYGFRALPGGQRTADGFSYAGGFGRIFSSTSSYLSAYRYFMGNGSMPTYVASSNDGLSIRCIKDTEE